MSYLRSGEEEEAEPMPPSTSDVAFEVVRGYLDSEDFILRGIMSELDLLVHKSDVYRKLAGKTLGKRRILAERVDTQAEGMKSFPDMISKQARADPAQLSDANAILTEESMYTVLRKRISTRYGLLVADKMGLRDLRNVSTVTPQVLSRFRRVLKQGMLQDRQRRWIKAVETIEIVLQGESRRGIREHLYGTLVAFVHNPRSVINTLRFHYMILGPPGTGKSHLAQTMADYFWRIGIFVQGELQNTKKPDLVAPFVGQSAGKTRRAVYSALEGVLFLDEAYALVSCEYVPTVKNPREVARRDQYGLEAVDQLVDMMTELKGLICIIAAGYQEEMDVCLLGTNPGLRRRFAHRWVLQRYTSDGLLSLLADMLSRRDNREDLLFRKARRMFGASAGFTVPEAVASLRPLVLALDSMNALPNQAGDIEKLAHALYEMYTVYDGAHLVRDDDLVLMVNSFLASADNPARIHALHRSEGAVDAVDHEGIETRFQV